MVSHRGDIPLAWQTALDRCLGDRTWRDIFYTATKSDDLFGRSSPVQTRDFDVPKIEAYFKGRLQSIFAGVAKNALPLRNGKGTCMYLLFFACGNERGAGPALRIANHILKQ
jgi:hypothetical protein